MKLTFFSLGIELVRYETLQHSSDELNMLFKCVGINEDIIDVDNHELVSLVAEGIVNEGLEF